MVMLKSNCHIGPLYPFFIHKKKKKMLHEIKLCMGTTRTKQFADIQFSFFFECPHTNWSINKKFEPFIIVPFFFFRDPKKYPFSTLEAKRF